MHWWQFLGGVLIGALLGITGIALLTHDRTQRLEATADFYKGRYMALRKVLEEPLTLDRRR